MLYSNSKPDVVVNIINFMSKTLERLQKILLASTRNINLANIGLLETDVCQTESLNQFII